MPNDHLTTYLNDHLAGSTAALELLEHLERADAELAGFARDLRRDIEDDRGELEALIAKLGSSPSVLRQAAAWVTEKVARLKLSADDPVGDTLKRLEALEAVAIGIHGKSLLWRVLQSVPAAAGPDYAALISRAEEQKGRVEAARLSAARAAFA